MKTETVKEFGAACLYVLAGLACLYIPNISADVLMVVTGVLAALSAIPFIIHGIKHRHELDYAAAVLCVIVAGLCFAHQTLGQQFIGLLYVLYLLVNGIIFGIQAVLDRGRPSELVPAIAYIGLAVFFFFNRLDVKYVLGVWFIMQGLQCLWEDLCFTNPYDAKYWSFRGWMNLPSFIVSILPAFIIGHLQDARMKKEATHFDARKNDKPVNFRIWIHSGTYGARLYGHMTFSYDDVMYSYGDYDVPAEKLFGTVGPGIFFTVNSPLYANNCCVIEHSPLFEYGLHLSEEQLKKFEKMSRQIFSNTTPWQCPMEKAESEGDTVTLAEYGKMYANRLWYRTSCQFRKYTSGQWKWYSLLGNNCSNFAAAKLNEIGLNLPISTGVVSPGEYYEVMETLFKDPDSCVITRSWHSADVPETLFTVGGIQGYAGYDTK